ncbi:MAG: DUF4129 domain-containing protein, partial [Marinobacter sp.]
EVWLEDQGWVRVDPTAAIAPSRIEFGLREAMAEEGSFLENNLTSPQRYGDFAMLQWASLQLDLVNYHWQRWVVGYQGQSQMNLMSRLPGGIGMRELGYITAALVGLALLVAGLVSALSMRRGARQDGFRRVVGAWHRLCEQVGVPVRTGETPGVLAERMAQARPAISETVRIFARRVNSHYYSSPSATQADEDTQRLRRLLNTMKRQLRRGHEPEPVARTPPHD